MEVVMKTKEVFSLLWAKLFEGWGNRTMKQAQLRRQRGGIFFLRGREPEFVLNKEVKEEVEDVEDFAT